MDDNLIEIYRQLSKLEAQVEFKDTLIKYLIGVITTLSGVIVALWRKIDNRSSKDSDAIRERLK